MGDRDEELRRSASAEAAALRRGKDEPDPEAGAQRPEEDERDGPEQGRPSASAEAAALRWRDEHTDE